VTRNVFLSSWRQHVISAFAVVVAAALVFGGSSTASAEEMPDNSVRHHAGFSLKNGGFIGNFLMPDGSVTYCLDLHHGPPTSHVYGEPTRANYFVTSEGPTLTSSEVQALQHLMMLTGKTSDPVEAAATQLAVWRITGLFGRSTAYVSRLAGKHAGVVLARSSALLEQARALPAMGPPTVTLNLDTADIPSSGTATWVVPGTGDRILSGDATLDGAVFSSSGTNRLQVDSGMSYPFHWDGDSGDVKSIAMTVVAEHVPLRGLIIYSPPERGLQRLLSATTPEFDSRATASVDVAAPVLLAPGPPGGEVSPPDSDSGGGVGVGAPPPAEQSGSGGSGGGAAPLGGALDPAPPTLASPEPDAPVLDSPGDELPTVTLEKPDPSQSISSVVPLSAQSTQGDPKVAAPAGQKALPNPPRGRPGVEREGLSRGDALAFTGSDSSVAGGSALALVIAGWAMLLVGRRRRSV
jgi:hypothetical protein